MITRIRRFNGAINVKLLCVKSDLISIVGSPKQDLIVFILDFASLSRSLLAYSKLIPSALLKEEIDIGVAV
jgi:hypothetical protein